MLPGGGGGEGTLIFSYIRRLGSFLGFKILNFKILRFSEKLIFWGVLRFCGHFYEVITKLDYI